MLTVVPSFDGAACRCLSLHGVDGAVGATGFQFTTNVTKHIYFFKILLTFALNDDINKYPIQ